MANLSVNPEQVQAITVDPSQVQHAPESQGFLSDVGDTLKQYWDKINPVTAAQGLVQQVSHPIAAGKSYGQQNTDLANKAIEAFKAGDYSEAARHTLSYFINGIPGVGAMLDEAGEKAKTGDYKGAIADTAALATQLIGAKALPGATDTLTEPGAISGPLKTAAKVPVAVASGVKAATPAVATGAAMIGASEALGVIPGMEWPARIALGYPAIRTIAGGVKSGIAAAKATMAEVPAAAVAASTEDTALLDGIAQGFGYKSFSGAPETAQETIRTVASRIDTPTAPETAAPAAPVAPSQPTPSPEPIPAGPRKTPAQEIDDYLASRRAGADQAGVTPAPLRSSITRLLSPRRRPPLLPLPNRLLQTLTLNWRQRKMHCYCGLGIRPPSTPRSRLEIRSITEPELPERWES